MALLVRYVHATGTIVGVWESTTLAVLEAQQVEEDPVHGYLLCTAPHPGQAFAASTVEHAYQVVNGALVRRSRSEKGD